METQSMNTKETAVPLELKKFKAVKIGKEADNLTELLSECCLLWLMMYNRPLPVKDEAHASSNVAANVGGDAIIVSGEAVCTLDFCLCTWFFLQPFPADITLMASVVMFGL